MNLALPMPHHALAPSLLPSFIKLITSSPYLHSLMISLVLIFVRFLFAFVSSRFSPPLFPFLYFLFLFLSSSLFLFSPRSLVSFLSPSRFIMSPIFLRGGGACSFPCLTLATLLTAYQKSHQDFAPDLTETHPLHQSETLPS